MTQPPPLGPYRTPWERFKVEAWTGLTEWGTLVLYGVLALLLDGLREYLETRHVAEPWVRAALLAEWVTLITRFGPKAIRAVFYVVETVVIALHDLWYVVRHGSRRIR